MVVPFFLWNQGTPLQKSQIELLRSLLHIILEFHPDWIADTFPTVWDNWKAADEEEPPSLVEVRQGFDRLLSKRTFKLCIMVDGVDEFDGDHNELALYLKNLCGPNTKVVLSSRPIPDSVAAFGACPQLRLQDLTINDIRIFVKSHLTKNIQVKVLLRAHPVEANRLIIELQEIADGVFLWVHLVVKLLIEGIQKEEQIADLQRRLRAMPPTLESLYIRMMENMDHIHQVKAAETFRIVESWNEKAMKTSLSALLLSATEAGKSSDKGPLTVDKVKGRCKKVEAFIRNRCCGLLEVHRRHYDHNHARTMHAGLIEDFTRLKLEDLAITDSSVQYLYRTVAEFLRTDAIWSKICSLTAESFDTEARLTDACYFMIEHQPSTNRATGEIWNWVNNYAIFARGITKTNDITYLKQMRLLDETMIEFHQVTQDSSLHWSSHWPLATMKKFGDPALEQRLLKGHSFVTFAIRIGFYQFLRLQPKTNNLRISHELYALDSCSEGTFIAPLHVRSETLKFLLQGNQANTMIERYTSWQLALHLAYSSIDDNTVLDVCRLLEIYILAGADVNDVYINGNTRTSTSHIVKFKLRHYRGSSKTDKADRIPGSELINVDESQIQQYAQKLEALLRERGVIDHWEAPTPLPGRGTISPLSPAHQSMSPYAPPVYRSGWDSNIEREFRQLSVSPPAAQHAFAMPAHVGPSQNLLYPYYPPKQSFGHNGYLDQRWGHSTISTLQTPNFYHQTPLHQSLPSTMYSPTAGYGHPPSPYFESWPPQAFETRYGNRFT